MQNFKHELKNKVWFILKTVIFPKLIQCSEFSEFFLTYLQPPPTDTVTVKVGQEYNYNFADRESKTKRRGQLLAALPGGLLNCHLSKWSYFLQ